MTSEELRIIAEVHDQWALEMDEQVPPDAALVKAPGEPSQYPEGKVDVSCTAEQEDELQRRIQVALGRTP